MPAVDPFVFLLPAYVIGVNICADGLRELLVHNLDDLRGVLFESEPSVFIVSQFDCIGDDMDLYSSLAR